MAQNHCQWTSALDHLNDKLTVSAITPAPVLPPCEVYGIFGCTGVECQLGSVAGNLEQVNYAQYNQEFRNNQNFYNKTPQNLFGQQTAPPGYANNQRFPQKSSMELLLENFVMGQTKQIQELKT